jgi:GTP cyclohydrolase I
MFTGSVTTNRITLGLPPGTRQVLYDEARDQGMKPSEYMRHILIARGEELTRQRLLQTGPEHTRAAEIVAFIQKGTRSSD